MTFDMKNKFGEQVPGFTPKTCNLLSTSRIELVVCLDFIFSFAYAEKL
jgi:hypothetical protein